MKLRHRSISNQHKTSTIEREKTKLLNIYYIHMKMRSYKQVSKVRHWQNCFFSIFFFFESKFQFRYDFGARKFIYSKCVCLCGGGDGGCTRLEFSGCSTFTVRAANSVHRKSNIMLSIIFHCMI